LWTRHARHAGEAARLLIRNPPKFDTFLCPAARPSVAYALARLARLRSSSKPPGLLLPCQPALANRPPAGPGWLHQIKFRGYRVIPCQMAGGCGRIRDAVAALPVESAVVDGELSSLAPTTQSIFETLRSRQGRQGRGCDLREVDGRKVRPEPMEVAGRGQQLLSRKSSAMRDGIQVHEAITGDRAIIFMDLGGIIVPKRTGYRYLSGRTQAWLLATLR
jgi:bifunctional non-homologous end joining protein LigD